MIKKEGSYFVDENNNKWDADYFSKENTLVNCTDCSKCSYRSDCSKCFNCSNCSYCFNYKEQPMIYTTKKIGSRFEEAVLRTHKNNPEFIEKVKVLFEWE